MTRVRRHLLRRLAAGDPRSGSAMATELGVSRAAVAKQVARLREAGWPITTTAAGYRLEPGHRPLDAAALETGLAPVAERIARFDLLDRVDSTSDYLARLEPAPVGLVQLCVAEAQHAGRGRRGRSWHARPGGSITFSLAATLALAPSSLAGLSLAAGVACAERLRRRGVAGVAVKWPNDLQVDGAKLGGLLVEISGEAGGPSRVILGVGVNHHLGPDFPDTGNEVTDLVRCRPELADQRTRVLAELVLDGIGLLERFPAEGLAPWIKRWQGFDALAGREVEVDAPGGPAHGTVIGIDADGALRVQGPEGERRFHSGEVSVRATP